jgi:hypothetical protein
MAVATGGLVVTAPSVAPAHAATATSSYAPVTPARLLDTRAGGAARPSDGSLLTIPVRTLAGVPRDAVAAAVTLTATESAGPGFVTLWGDGTRPTTSALNLDAPDQTRSNFAIVPIGADGAIRAYLQVGTHVVVDLAGVFRPASAATSGRFVPLGPIRALDTRSNGASLQPGEVRPVSLVGAGVPADATAAVVSFTGIGPAGWWSAWQAGTAWPGTTVVNVSTAGDPGTASSLVRLAGGSMNVTSNVGGDVVVDVLGYITGSTAASSSTGLFVPMTPTRVLDTRGDPGPVGRMGAGTAINAALNPYPLATTASVTGNITAVLPSGPGYLTAYPASTPRPTASVANVVAGQVLATGSFVPTSTAGIEIYSMAATDLVVDLTGYFVGTPVAAQQLPAPYTLMFQNPDGSLWTWNPCTPISVMINTDKAPANAVDDLVAVVAQLRAATGLPFTVTGTTTLHKPFATAGAPGVIVHWMTAQQDASLSGNTLGWGGASGISAGNGFVLYSGEVRLKAGVDYSAFGGDGLLDLLLHELGHVAGIGHVTASDEIMYPSLSRLFGRYQRGDLAGLKVVGAPSGCHTTGFAAVPTASALAADGGALVTPMLITREGPMGLAAG